MQTTSLNASSPPDVVQAFIRVDETAGFDAHGMHCSLLFFIFYFEKQIIWKMYPGHSSDLRPTIKGR